MKAHTGHFIKKKSWTFSKGSPQVPEGIHSFCFDFATFFVSKKPSRSTVPFFKQMPVPGVARAWCAAFTLGLSQKLSQYHFILYILLPFLNTTRVLFLWQYVAIIYPILSEIIQAISVAVCGSCFFYEMGWGNRPWKKMGSSLRLSLYIKVVPRFNRSFYNWTMSFYRHFFCFYGMPFQPYFTSHPNSVYKMEVFQQVHFI